ncbi:MAG: DEAD/DEAH box helicase, partial [Candidatus Kapaibacterium sp.]
VCRMVKQTLSPAEFIRMGRHENTDHADILFQTVVREHGLEAAEERLRRARVVVATVTFLNSNPELFNLCRFTTAIVDEAAQILEPHLVGMISRVKRFILIGDEKQLPAVLSVSERARTVRSERLTAMGLADLHVSLFERLLRCCIRNGWMHAYGMLTHQGRMHADICDIASALSYDNRLTVMSERQRVPLPGVREVVSEREGGRLPAAMLTEVLRHRCVFIPTPPGGTATVNLAEAQTCAELADLFYEHSRRTGTAWNDVRLGIITPFRAQIDEIRRALPAHLRSTVTIDTVERFQGSERDIIILSPVISSAARIGSIRSLLVTDDAVIDRKLNVALTRARERFILLGAEDILRSLPQYADLIGHITRTGIRIANGNATM